MVMISNWENLAAAGNYAASPLIDGVSPCLELNDYHALIFVLDLFFISL
jgi:hypothetical protein